MMIILDVLNDQYCLLVDGDTRRLEKPKLKNLKHIQLTNMKVDTVLEYLERGELPENHVIKNKLNSLMGTGDIERKEGC
jgi:ribosomal protein L14E/L6E/L27E